MTGAVDVPVPVGREFRRQRFQLRDDVPAALAPDQHPPARTLIADAGADPLAAPALVGREVAEVRAMAFARVHHVKSFAAHALQHPADRLDGRACQRQVVPMLSTYPPLPQKSVCMSMTSKTVLSGRSAPFHGHGYGLAAT